MQFGYGKAVLRLLGTAFLFGGNLLARVAAAND
jgi:hypothetical protein